MQFSLLLVLSSAALVSAGGPHSTVKCCTKACPNGQEKYYSIDKKFNQCGETCFDPLRYNILHIFEAGLTSSPTSNSPCADRGYSDYINTPTHGVFGLSITLDLYGPGPNK